VFQLEVIFVTKRIKMHNVSPPVAERARKKLCVLRNY